MHYTPILELKCYLNWIPAGLIAWSRDQPECLITSVTQMTYQQSFLEFVVHIILQWFNLPTPPLPLPHPSSPWCFPYSCFCLLLLQVPIPLYKAGLQGCLIFTKLLPLMCKHQQRTAEIPLPAAPGSRGHWFSCASLFSSVSICTKINKAVPTDA